MKGTRFLLAMMVVILACSGVVSAAAAPANASNTVSAAAAGAPNDVYYSKQWALPFIRPILAAGATHEVTVAVLDSGIDLHHEDLSGKVVESVNFTDSRTETDVQGHGTHVAGILAANINNSIGIAGVASNIRLLNVKVVEDNGMVWPSNAAKGIVWAVDHGAQVINMSFTMPGGSDKLADAVRYAAAHNVVLVAAAGNHVNSKTYPAAYPEVIAVAALNSDGTIWSGSEGSDWVKVYAPGADIFSTMPGNTYGYKSGSSMATAYASGMAATVVSNLSDQGDGQPSDVRSALEKYSAELLK